MTLPNLAQLFYDDYYPPGHLWVAPGQTRVVYWSDRSAVVDGVATIRLFNATETALAQQAFDLWGQALDSIEFRYTPVPAEAHILVGWTGEYGTWGHWNAVTGPSGVRDTGAIQLNGLLTFAPEALVHTLLHEIGNVLGLGDIVPSDDFVSVLEDPFPRPFVSGWLSDFDVALVRFLYAEPQWPPGVGVSAAHNVIVDASQPQALVDSSAAVASPPALTSGTTAGASSPTPTPVAPATVSPLMLTSSPVDGAKGVGPASRISMTFSRDIYAGQGAITLKTQAGDWVQTFDPKGGDGSVILFGAALLLSPKDELKAFTPYVLELGAGALADAAGHGVVLPQTYDFRTTAPDGLYQFFAVAFDAAPGVTYMGQMAEAWNAGMTLEQIVEVFTQKKPFTDVFAADMSAKDFAAKLVERVVETSASDTLKTAAAQDIANALAAGWSRGKTIYTVFSKLAAMPVTDASWGGTAQLLRNEVAVARYFTEQMEVGSTDPALLQRVIAPVTATTDVSTPDKIVAIIGNVPPGG